MRAHRLAAVIVLGLAACGLAATELDTKVDAKLAEVKKGLDDTFIVEREGIYVVAGNLSRAQFERYRRHTIRACTDAMWKAYFKKKPDYPIVIYLFVGDASYRAWAKKLFNDTNVAHFGYYKPGAQTMVMNIQTGGGTLVHEMTHALMKPDFPNVPTWFDEGLSSLHEQCRIGRDTIIGLENWRLPALQKAIKAKRHVALDKLLASSTGEFRGANEGLNYAEARYLCLYLQRKGLLRRYYREFCDGVKADPTGAKTLVKVTGKSIADLEKAWLPWVMKLRFPPGR